MEVEIMTPALVAVRGVVRGGVVVPETANSLPEGAQVTILVGDLTVAPELAREFAAWERASDEAWGMIDDLEKESP
jgi:hypothetical protein